MTYGPAQKIAIYKYRSKIRQSDDFKAKVKIYNATQYAILMENPEKLAHRLELSKWARYYASDCTRDVRRLFM